MSEEDAVELLRAHGLPDVPLEAHHGWHLVQILCQHRLGDGDPAPIAARWATLARLVDGDSHLTAVLS